MIKNYQDPFPLLQLRLQNHFAPIVHPNPFEPVFSYFNERIFIYHISANSFCGNYSFLNLTLCTVTFDHSTYRFGNYSREEIIQGQKLFAEIFQVEDIDSEDMF